MAVSDHRKWSKKLAGRYTVVVAASGSCATSIVETKTSLASMSPFGSPATSRKRPIGFAPPPHSGFAFSSVNYEYEGGLRACQYARWTFLLTTLQIAQEITASRAAK